MTAVQTLSQPKAKRFSDKPAPQRPAEPEEQETPLDERTRRYLAIDEQDILEGQSVHPPLTLKEIVAICKEARAERYAEEQSLANHR